jgi:hypothetical protein
MVATAAFGTFLTLFAVSINNHLPAALCAAVLLSLALSIWYEGHNELWRWGLAGLFGGLLVACELPALSFFTAMAVGLAWKDFKRFGLAFVPAAAVVAAAALGTNYLAHDTFKPAYAMRSETDPAKNWYRFEYERDGKVRQSYWSNPGGIDSGEASIANYAFHVLVGHHGIFSLTPMWLVSLVGLGMALANRRSREIAIAIALVTMVCLAFYIFRPKVIDRNYGGMTSGFRWVFWMAPLWLFAMLPALDWMSRRRAARAVVLLLLAFSCLSVAYPWQPWKQPWIADFLLHLGWIKF